MITGRRLVYVVLFLSLALIAFLFLRIYLPVTSFISTEMKKEIPHELASEILFSGEIERNYFDGWKVISTTKEIADLVEFDNRYLAATSGGLVALDQEGHREEVYTHLNGFLANDLTALAVYKGRLFIGSKKGLMSLYSGNLACYEVESLKNITCLGTDGEFLYVGTVESGVIKFDGRTFTNDLNLLTGADFEKVTAILASGERLAIGTYDKGVFIYINKAFLNISTDEGLLSENVRALAVKEGLIYVGTPYGVDVIDDRLRVKNVLDNRFVEAMAFGDGFSLFGTFDDGVYRRTKKHETHHLNKLQINGFKEIAGKVFALTGRGMYLLKYEQWIPFYLPGREEITSNHITALQVGRAKRVWVGTFEHGVNILTGGKVSKKMEELAINHLSLDKESGIMWVTTTGGAVAGQRTYNKKDGLIGNNVAHIGIYGEQMVFSTNRGISLYEDGAFRSLYTFHGLINNHAYTSERFNGKLYVGTLGGISVLGGKKVVANLTTANSGLGANWVTALKKVGGWLYVGTYGGGVCRMNKSGRWEDLGLGPVEVNLNAVCYDEPHLLWGTLDRGVCAYNIETGEWENVVRPLASPNVTSIAASDELLFFGTDNGLSRVDREEYYKQEEALSQR